MQRPVPRTSRAPRARRRALVVCLTIAIMLVATPPVDAEPQAAAVVPATDAPSRAAGPGTEMRTDTVPLTGAPAFAVLDPAGDGAGGASWRADDVAPFVALGASWRSGSAHEAKVVIRYADGTTSELFTLDADGEHGEDTGANPRIVTDPVALDRDAVGWTLSLDGTADDLQVHLVRAVPTAAGATGAGTSIGGDVLADTADGMPGPAGIRSRASWGARPRKPTEPCAPGGRPEGLGCVATSGVVNAVVHHTVNANDYSPESVPQLLRSIQAFHQDVDGFDDIGYNFVVDRFGTVWEARAGGADRPVVGGHVKGFNTGSVGVAALGTFESAAPNEATLDGIARTIAWKFAMRNVDPFGQVTVRSNGGDRYDEGELVTVATIDGHGNIGATSCPGAQLFARLPDIRQRVAALLPAVTGEADGSDRFSGRLTVRGFALRRGQVAPVAVALDVNGVRVAQMTADQPNAIVAARFPGIGANHGWSFTLPVGLDTNGQACVTELSTNTLLACRDLNPVTPPFGDLRVEAALGPPRLTVSGWLIDPDSSEPTVVHLYLDGRFTAVWADDPRPDVAAAYPGYGANRGFRVELPTTEGEHTLCAFGINVPRGDHLLMRCSAVLVGSEPVNRVPPRGWIDDVRGGGESVLVSGWAFDPDTSSSIGVHVYVDGVGTPITADAPRPDVAAAFAGAPVRSGFVARIPAAPGPHRVCLYAIDANAAGPHTLLGCRDVVSLVKDASPPFGALDVAAGGAGRVTVSGWAIDPDTVEPIAVHVYVDGAGVPLVADRERPDVAAAFPGVRAAHGFAASLPAARGTRTVCAYAINNLASGANTLLACRAVTVT